MNCEISSSAGFQSDSCQPQLKELFGEKSYPDLLSIPDHVDVVDIFRNPDAVPEIVEQAIAKGAHVVWMQPGAENMAAAERATQAGLEVIMGVCIMHNAFTKLPAQGVKP
jgi:predicted CoA-binding protein